MAPNWNYVTQIKINARNTLSEIAQPWTGNCEREFKVNSVGVRARRPLGAEEIEIVTGVECNEFTDISISSFHFLLSLFKYIGTFK